MKSSYKIALLLAAGVLVFVLGYYATQDPEGGADDRVAAGPAAGDDGNGNGGDASPTPAPAASNTPPARPARRPAPGPNSGDRFYEDLKRSLQATQNNTSAPSNPADAPPAGRSDTPADTTASADTTAPESTDEPAPVPALPGAAAARANTQLNVPGAATPPAARPAAGANAETAADPEASDTPPATTPPAAAPAQPPRPTPAPAATATPPDDGRPFFGPVTTPAPTRPQAAPAAAAATPPATARTYTIRSGDTFEAVAQRELGDGRRWVDIAQANPLVDPTRLRVGQEIRLPGARGANATAAPRDAAERGAAGTPGRVTYTVRPGDTLSGIAQQYYGSAADWRRIFDANRNILRRETDLRPGQDLVIPPGGRRAQ